MQPLEIMLNFLLVISNVALLTGIVFSAWGISTFGQFIWTNDDNKLPKFIAAVTIVFLGTGLMVLLGQKLLQYWNQTTKVLRKLKSYRKQRNGKGVFKAADDKDVNVEPSVQQSSADSPTIATPAEARATTSC